MSYEHEFLASLVLTLISEIPVVYIFVHRIYKKSNAKNIISCGVIASSLTLPYLWFILPVFINEHIPYLLIGESFVILIEAFIYKQFLGLSEKEAFITSLVANITSIIVGLLIL